MQGGCSAMREAAKDAAKGTAKAKTGYSDSYSSGWDRIFGKKENEGTKAADSPSEAKGQASN